MLDKTWLIFGCNGQDGSIMCDLLLNKGYKNIHGVVRRASNFNTQRLEHIFDRLKLHYGDVTDAMSVYSIISKVSPDYIINFAAQSHVKVSSELENYTLQTNTIGVLNILQAVKNLNLKNTRIYQAGTSEEYGNESDGIKKLNEESKKSPVSIYGISKLAAENICNMYRDAYNMFIVTAVLFNHESDRRGYTFVTQKVSNYVAKFKKDSTCKPLELGNLDSKRDWGAAEDYMDAVYLMLTYKQPINFVISTGELHSVKEFVEVAFKQINVNIKWQGTGINECGVISQDDGVDRVVVKVNPKYYRDLEINNLIGDSKLAKDLLNWEPKITFENLVKNMVNMSCKKI